MSICLYLGSPEASEGRVLGLVGPGDPAPCTEGGPPVRVVDVEEGPVRHWPGEVQAEATVVVDLGVQR